MTGVLDNMTRKSLFALLDKTRDEAQNWTTKAFKASNDQLLEYLSNCLAVLEQLVAADVSVRKDFNDHYIKHGFKSTAATPLATKIVRYVFRTERKRCASYSRILRIAQQNKIDSVGLAEWVAAQGGVEEVRRTKDGVKPAVVEARLIDMAQMQLSKRVPLIEPVKMPSELQPSREASHSFSLALLLKNKDGKSSIVCGLNDQRLLKMALVRVGKSLAKNADISGQKHNDANAAKQRSTAVAAIAAIDQT